MLKNCTTKAKILSLLFIMLFFAGVANSQPAQQVPVKIVPDQIISTCFDEIQLGDPIKFKTLNDVYLNNKLYIAKDTPVIGIVDFIAENGWANDNAQIIFKKFKTTDVNNKPVLINSDVKIDGFEILKYKGNRFAQFFNYCGVIFRGKEIEILPEKDNVVFNIWIEGK